MPISSYSCENNINKISHENTFLGFEVCAREICEKFVYKHSETINDNMLKISLLFNRRITQESLGLRMRNFHVIVFI